MKKLYKLGFTLVELLIVLSIVAIMTVMFILGFKHNVKSAYKNYYYNVYDTMKAVIMFANEKHEGNLYEACKDAFNLNNTPSSGTEFSVKNGVKYEVSNDGSDYKIVATVPSEKGPVHINMKYFTAANYGILVPGAVSMPDSNDDFKLYERRDLLPCFIRNGKLSEIYHYYDDVNNTYKTKIPSGNDEKRVYYSFKDAYCRLNDNYRDSHVAGNNDSYIGSCSGITQSFDGVVYAANPSKVSFAAGGGGSSTSSSGGSNSNNNGTPCGYYHCPICGKNTPDPNYQGSCYTVCPKCGSSGSSGVLNGYGYGYWH